MPDAYASPQRWIWNLPNPIFLTIPARPVFISYSRMDASVVEPLFNRIQAKSMPAWMDVQGVHGGDDWFSRIATALQSSRFVVDVISANSLDSKWVRRELEFADNRSIPILPVVIGDVDITDWFELRFDALQRLTCDPDNATSVDDVVNRIKAL